MSHYRIEAASKGFIAERDGGMGMMGTRYAFSTAKELTDWLLEQLSPPAEEKMLRKGLTQPPGQG